jgi:hypothetical protein
VDAVLGKEFPDTQGCLACCTVMVHKPGTRKTFVRLLPTNCFSKSLQNGSVGSLIHVMALGKKFAKHQTLHVKESDQHCLNV